HASSLLFSSHAFVFCRGSYGRRRHLPVCAPTFPTKAAATVSVVLSSAASGSAGSRRGAGPNTTCALCRGSYSELWQTHLNTSLSPFAAFTHAVIGQPVWTQITE